MVEPLDTGTDQAPTARPAEARAGTRMEAKAERPGGAKTSVCVLCREEFSAEGMNGSIYCFTCSTHARCACGDPVDRK